MELEVIRISSGTDSTNGILFEVDRLSPSPYSEGYRCKRTFLAYTLEDEYREEKVYGETRIPNFTQSILSVFLIFILVCFTFLTFLILSIFSFIVEILMNIQRVAYSSETPKKTTKSRRTVL